MSYRVDKAAVDPDVEQVRVSKIADGYGQITQPPPGRVERQVGVITAQYKAMASVVKKKGPFGCGKSDLYPPAFDTVRAQH